MSKAAHKVEIINRVKPCNCGCGGSDSWHRQKITRVIYDEVIESGFARTALLPEHEYEKTGIAKFPWGTSRVVWCRYHPDFVLGDWWVDLGSQLDLQKR